MITVVCCVVLVTAAVLAAIHLEARWLAPRPAVRTEDAVDPAPNPAPVAAPVAVPATGGARRG